MKKSIRFTYPLSAYFKQYIGVRKWIARSIAFGAFGLFSMTASAQMASGTYTVDPNSPNSSTNFTTIQGFFTALTNNSNAIAQGGARLEIYPGTYTEQITIPPIAGLGVTQSGADRLVITSHSSGTAKVQFSAFSYWNTQDNGAVFFLNGADYITFQNLQIENTSSTGSRYAYCIQGYTGSDYITVDNCDLKAGVYLGSFPYAYGVGVATTDDYFPSGGVNNGEHWVVKNSTIEARFGVYFYGGTSRTATNWTQDFVINDNVFVNNNFPVYTYYIYDVVAKNNKISATHTYQSYGFFINYSNNVDIIGNDIASCTSYPIYMRYPNRYNTSNVSGQSIVANNMAHSYASTRGYAGYFYYPNNVDIVYNSFYGLQANGTALQYYYGLYLYYDMTNTRVENNVFRAEATTTLQYLYRYGPGSFYSDGNGMNYNTFYSEAANAGNVTPRWYWRGNSGTTNDDNNLSDHISNASQNANSQEADPGYIATDDLHVNGVLLYQKGTPVTSVTTDYDGNARATVPSPGIHEYTPKDNDAGIVRFDDPVSQCADTNDIIVTVRNYAKLDLDSFEVHFSYVGNGGANGSGSMSIVASPALTPGADTTINVGQVFMTSGAPGYDFKAWTMEPNGVNDEQLENDSSLFSTQTAMVDTFTIGGITPSFATFTDAVSALNNFGVCGPVVFNVRSGIYPEQVLISDLQGTNSTNTVLFQEDPSNTGIVEIEYTTIGAINDAAVVKLNNTSFITFDGISIENKSSGNYSYAVELMGNSNDNTFKNCLITVPSNTNFRSRVFSAQSNGVNNTTLDNNDIIGGGYYGVYFYGDFTNPTFGNTITNNYITGAYYYGLYYYYQGDVKIVGNEIDMRATGNSSANSFSYGLLMYCPQANDVDISNNYIKTNGYNQVTVAGSRNVGEVRIVNNKFHSGDTTNSTTSRSWYGLYFNGGFGTIAHNLFLREKNNSSGGTTAYITGGLNDFHNNLVVTIGSGNAMFVSGSFSITEADNNAYVMIETTNGKPANGLSYMTGQGYDDNGLEFTSAVFDDLDSLYTCFDSLVSMGTYLENVPLDMDAITRNTSAPTIGPNEYTTPDAFTIGDDFDLCSGDSVYIGQEVNGGSYSWSTGDSSALILVTMPGTYSVTMAGGCGAANGSIVVSGGEAIPAFTNSRSWLTAVFTNTSAKATTYMWDFDDGSTSTDEHPSHLFPATGKYNVCLTATGECGSETTCQEVAVSDYVGIAENSLSDAVSIYPNPASEMLTINVDNVIGDELNIELSNIAGQVVITLSLSEFNGSAKEEIDVNDLTEGVYFVKVYTNEATTTVRVVVQK